MRRARACVTAAVLLAAVAAGGRAEAGGSFADREAARTLSGKAYEQFEAKHYRRAIELFQQAEARFHAPPHVLYTARCQVKLGLFLEAKATFERVVAEKLPADAPAPFREAQASARAELTEVEALTPNLVIALPAAAPPETRILLDGEPLAASSLGRPVPANPGVHVVIAEAPGTPRVERKVVLTSGGGDERVDLSPAPPALPRSIVPVVVSFSVGAAGLVAGTVGAVLVRNATGSTATALRATEVAGFTLAGLGTGVGVVFVVLRARQPPSQPPSVSGHTAPRWARSPRGAVSAQISVGPGSVSIGGSF